MSMHLAHDPVEMFVLHERNNGPGSATQHFGKQFLTGAQRVRARKELRAHWRSLDRAARKQPERRVSQKTTKARPMLVIDDDVMDDGNYAPYEQAMQSPANVVQRHTPQNPSVFDLVQIAQNAKTLTAPAVENKQAFDNNNSDAHGDNEWQWVDQERPLQHTDESEDSEAPSVCDWEFVSVHDATNETKQGGANSWVKMLKQAPATASVAEYLREPRWALEAKAAKRSISEASPWVLSSEMVEEYEYSKGRLARPVYAKTNKEHWRQTSRRNGHRRK